MKRIKVGDVKNNWTVIEYGGHNEKKSKIWKCKCDCGNESFLTTSYFNSTKSYKCKKCWNKEAEHSALIQKYVGKQINNWTILGHVGKDDKDSRLWKCKCECGHEKELTTSYLNSLSYSKCKYCWNDKEKTDKILSDKYIGNQIGTWKVLNLVGRNKHGSRIWQCECQCGYKRKFLTSYLDNNAKRKATTCNNCRMQSLHADCTTTDYIPKYMWNKFLSTSKSRGIKVEVTLKQVFDIFHSQGCKCALTGLPLYFGKNRSKYWKYTSASIDRIDSSKDYSLDNIQWVDKRINMMKHSYSQLEFIELCCLVAKNKMPSQPLTF